MRRVADKGAYCGRLKVSELTRKSARMIRFFNMDDRARMPWRFYGAARSVLARL